MRSKSSGKKDLLKDLHVKYIILQTVEVFSLVIFLCQRAVQNYTHVPHNMQCPCLLTISEFTRGERQLKSFIVMDFHIFAHRLKTNFHPTTGECLTPPGANPLVAERALLEVFAVLCDRGSAAYWKSLQIPVISSAHLANPCATAIVTCGEGSFNYRGVSTRGVRHSPELMIELLSRLFAQILTTTALQRAGHRWLHLRQAAHAHRLLPPRCSSCLWGGASGAPN